MQRSGIRGTAANQARSPDAAQRNPGNGATNSRIPLRIRVGAVRDRDLEALRPRFASRFPRHAFGAPIPAFRYRCIRATI
jgi:hypothetical protein